MLRCRLFGHRWDWVAGTKFVCFRCHGTAYGTGISDRGEGEEIYPPNRRTKHVAYGPVVRYFD